MQPRDQMSLRSSYGRSMTSGAIQFMVPGEHRRQERAVSCRSGIRVWGNSLCATCGAEEVLEKGNRLRSGKEHLRPFATYDLSPVRRWCSVGMQDLTHGSTSACTGVVHDRGDAKVANGNVQVLRHEDVARFEVTVYNLRWTAASTVPEEVVRGYSALTPLSPFLPQQSMQSALYLDAHPPQHSRRPSRYPHTQSHPSQP